MTPRIRTVAELAAEEKALTFNWSGASNLLARMPSSSAVKAAARAKAVVFNDAVRDIRQTGSAAASARLSHSPAAAPHC
jgi:hypothetical protein